MSENVILWIFGTLIAVLGVVLGSMWSQNIAFIRATEKRMTAVETIISLTNDRYAAILHSPHTPELDSLIEQYREEYLRRNYELTFQQWQRFEALTRAAMDDKDETAGYRIAAATINAFCCHKLKKDTPPYQRIE